MIVIAIIFSQKIELGNFTIFDFIKVNVEEIKFFSNSLFKFFTIFIIEYIIYLRFINHLSIIFAENIRGDFPKCVYYLAPFLGYKTVSLVHKNIPIQFYIFQSRLFKEYQLYEESITELSNDQVRYTKDIEAGDTSEINIGIFDTYKGNSAMLPKDITKHITILLRPEKQGVTAKRIYSDSLIDLLNKILNEYSSTKVYNLFLFTNPICNKKIYENVFNTKNDNYILKIYYFDNIKKIFKNKFIIIRP